MKPSTSSANTPTPRSSRAFEQHQSITSLPLELILETANHLDSKSYISLAGSRKFHEILLSEECVTSYLLHRLKRHPGEINHYLANSDALIQKKFRDALMKLSESQHKNEICFYLSQDDELCTRLGYTENPDLRDHNIRDTVNRPAANIKILSYAVRDRGSSDATIRAVVNKRDTLGNVIPDINVLLDAIQHPNSGNDIIHDAVKHPAANRTVLLHAIKQPDINAATIRDIVLHPDATIRVLELATHHRHCDNVTLSSTIPQLIQSIDLMNNRASTNEAIFNAAKNSTNAVVLEGAVWHPNSSDATIRAVVEHSAANRTVLRRAIGNSNSTDATIQAAVNKRDKSGNFIADAAILKAALENKNSSDATILTVVNHPATTITLLQGAIGNPKIKAATIRDIVNKRDTSGNLIADAAILKAALENSNSSNAIIDAVANHPAATSAILTAAISLPRCDDKTILAAANHAAATIDVLQGAIKFCKNKDTITSTQTIINLINRTNNPSSNDNTIRATVNHPAATAAVLKAALMNRNSSDATIRDVLRKRDVSGNFIANAAVLKAALENKNSSDATIFTIVNHPEADANIDVLGAVVQNSNSSDITIRAAINRLDPSDTILNHPVLMKAAENPNTSNETLAMIGEVSSNEFLHHRIESRLNISKISFVQRLRLAFTSRKILSKSGKSLADTQKNRGGI